MPAGDVYQLKMFGEIHDQQTLNVFYYRQLTSTPTNPGDDLIEAFRDVVETDLIGLISVSWGPLLYQVNGIDAFEFQEQPVSGVAGLVAGDCLPPFAAFGFKLQRANNFTRNGQKRFAGVPESSQVNGIATSGAYTALTAFAPLLAQTLNGGAGGDYEPVIVSFTLNGEPRATPVVNSIDSAQYKAITTQNTRKFGRGN